MYSKGIVRVHRHSLTHTLQDVAPFGELAVVTTSSAPTPQTQQAEEGEQWQDSIAEELVLDALATLVHEEMLASSSSSSSSSASASYGVGARGPSPVSASRGEVSAVQCRLGVGIEASSLRCSTALDALETHRLLT